MSKPKIHFILNRDEMTGDVRARCGKWLVNPRMQSTDRMEDVTCKFCMTKDHPAYEDYVGDGTDRKMEVGNG